jgi:integrase
MEAAMSEPVTLPILRRHKHSQQHYVWVPAEKKPRYFGKDPLKAQLGYQAYIAELCGRPAPPRAGVATVANVLEAYRLHAIAKYKAKSEINRILEALDSVNDLHGTQPANSFKARAFAEVRRSMLSKSKRKGKAKGLPRSRNYVNKLAKSIQTAWRWLATQELISAESAASVCSVGPLREGDGGAELGDVLPPHPGDVQKTLDTCGPMLADMLRVQLLTGARPGEIRTMRAEDISRAEDQPIPLPGTKRTVAARKIGETLVWMMAPGSHKTKNRGKARAIPIGPKAQAILDTWIPARGGYVFKTARGTIYSKASYARAVQRACDRAKVARWAPGQLRHKAGTDIAEQFDDATAAAVLGHAAGSNATKIYVEQSIDKGARAAARMG